jgi:hypothetical protein
VPLNQSGLKPKDIEKEFKLQMTAIENKRLPMKHASDIVWEALGQLRGRGNLKQLEVLCQKHWQG